MHHLSMLVSVCMRVKERRVVDMALGDRAAGSSWGDLVRGGTAKSAMDASPGPHPKEAPRVPCLLELAF